MSRKKVILLLFVITIFLLSKLEAKSWEWFGVVDGLPSNFVTSLAVDNKGRLWIGTWKGLAYQDGDLWKTLNATDGLLCEKITSLYFSQVKEKLWIGTLKGLYLWEEGKNIRKVLSEEVLVKDIFENQQDGTLYIATWGKGLFYRDNSDVWQNFTENSGFFSDYLTCVAGDQKGNIWVGSAMDKGFAVLQDGKWKVYTEHNSGILNNTITDIAFSPSQGWISNWAGVDVVNIGKMISDFKNWYHYQKLTFSKGKITSKTPYAIADNFARKIFYDEKKNCICLASTTGLSFYNFKKLWIIFSASRKIISRFDENKGIWEIEVLPYRGMQSDNIMDVCIKGGKIIVATDKGVGMLTFFERKE